jgi:hypothetical protein
MATTDPLTTIAIAAVIESYEVNYAFASLLFYDYILCFSEEVRLTKAHVTSHVPSFVPKVEYFWTGPWSLSRILYLAVRVHSVFICHSTHPLVRSDI